MSLSREAEVSSPADIRRLRDLLQAAVELELSTIPPYLCALYSLWPGTNDEASLIIRSVVVEEMLHMVLAANVLNAIGGQPRVTGLAHVPRYPHELPDGVVIDLLPFSPQAVEAFLRVENPASDHATVPHGDPLIAGRRPERHLARATRLMTGTGDPGKPTTIGAFYAEITDGLKEAAATLGEQALFCGDPARQVTPQFYYAGGGSVTPVHNLWTALAALTEIVDQGEGNPASMYDDDGDLGHYFRFKQLAYDRAYLPSDDAGVPSGPPIGVDFDAVYPMIANPRADEYSAQYRDPELRAASDAVNRTWSRLLGGIESAFNGHPEALLAAVPAMFRLRDQALVLLGNPLPAHAQPADAQPADALPADALPAGGGRHAGPTFEWVADW